MIDEIIVETEQDKYGNEVRIDRWEKFRHANGAYYAFSIRPVGDLETPVPEGVKWSIKDIVYDEEGEIVSSTQKNVGEFIGGMYILLPEDKALIPCCALNPTNRQAGVSKVDIDDWFYYALSSWGEEPEFLTIEERNELIAEEHEEDARAQM